MLTTSLTHHAKYHGGKDLANRKRHLAQVRTTLAAVFDDCDGKSAVMANILTQAELAAMEKTLLALGKVIKALEADAKEADRIKSAFDKRHQQCQRAVRSLPADTIVDKVALASLADMRHSLKCLAHDCVKYGPEASLRFLVQEALSSLALDMANGTADPAVAAAALRAAMPAHSVSHTGLIEDVTTLAVAQRLEVANRQSQREAVAHA